MNPNADFCLGDAKFPTIKWSCMYQWTYNSHTLIIIIIIIIIIENLNKMLISEQSTRPKSKLNTDT